MQEIIGRKLSEALELFKDFEVEVTEYIAPHTQGEDVRVLRYKKEQNKVCLTVSRFVTEIE